MTRKGVWDLQQVRDKYLQELWVNTNELMVWGTNASGALGLNAPEDARQSSPIQVPGTTWADINPNGKSTHYNANSTYMRKTDGTLWAWGENHAGQLGNNQAGHPTSKSSPIQIGSDTNWAYVTGGNNNAMAIKTDGTGWAWGEQEDYGNLGLNSRTNYSSPVQIPGTWSRLSAARFQGYGIKPDGTLWAWGANPSGELGLNQPSLTRISSPVQIPGTTWDDIASSQVTVATKTDGTLWSWGYGGQGELGLNDRTNRSSPTQVGSDTTWTSVQANWNHVMAFKSDGTLWNWGHNSSGMLGQNNRTEYSSPVQVPGTTWSKGSIGSMITFAIKTDGALWVWGQGSYGNLGLSQAAPTSLSSPVQIPGNWGTIVSADNHVYATRKILTD